MHSLSNCFIPLNIPLSYSQPLHFSLAAWQICISSFVHFVFPLLISVTTPAISFLQQLEGDVPTELCLQGLGASWCSSWLPPWCLAPTKARIPSKCVGWGEGNKETIWEIMHIFFLTYMTEQKCVHDFK